MWTGLSTDWRTSSRLLLVIFSSSALRFAYRTSVRPAYTTTPRLAGEQQSEADNGGDLMRRAREALARHPPFVLGADTSVQSRSRFVGRIRRRRRRIRPTEPSGVVRQPGADLGVVLAEAGCRPPVGGRRRQERDRRRHGPLPGGLHHRPEAHVGSQPERLAYRVDRTGGDPGPVQLVDPVGDRLPAERV